LAKDNRIKSLEKIIIELGHDPKDPKGTQALIRKKEEDIVALRKQMKLPVTIHPQTAEVAQQQEVEDVVSLLMRMNERIMETEKALEEAQRGKQPELAPQPSQTAPIVPAPTITAPSTAVTSAAPPPGSTSAAGASTSADPTAATVQEASLSWRP
jgi:hypothetical protein